MAENGIFNAYNWYLGLNNKDNWYPDILVIDLFQICLREDEVRQLSTARDKLQDMLLGDLCVQNVLREARSERDDSFTRYLVNTVFRIFTSFKWVYCC